MNRSPSGSSTKVVSVQIVLRLFLGCLGLCCPLSLSCAGAADAPAAQTRGRSVPLSSAELARLNTALEPLHAQYDPAERMLRQPISSPGYHTTLKGGTVHSTRAALNYAVALLDTGEERWRVRAEEILDRVVSLQDQDPKSKTYGIWSWFLEEPLDRMSPPDWNWADFCGAALLQVTLDHRERISPDLMKRVDEAIRHAARSVQRRNVGPGYTNIAIMGTYVTLVTAELYGLADLREYALARWRKFHAYTVEHGSFSEYNSPTYTVVALKELGRMREHVRDPEARRLTEEVYRLAWREIARHFHAPTRQWAGPHSRCYSTLLRADVLSLIQRATGGRIAFGADQPSVDECRPRLDCPAEFEPLFRELKEPREVVQTFVQGKPPVRGVTYLHPLFTVGSVNRGDLWNQRRALVAYWGTPQAPACLHLRFLHDDYDFAAVQFFSTQKQGRVVAGLNFATDGGNRHISLDRITDRKFQARDLRVRFEFGGAAKSLRIPGPGEASGATRFKSGAVHFSLAAPYVRFGELAPHWTSGHDEKTSWLDLVLYDGSEREFNLGEMSAAAIALALEMGEVPGQSSGVKTVEEGGHLSITQNDLSLSIPVKPAKVSALQRAFGEEEVEPWERPKDGGRRTRGLKGQSISANVRSH